MNSLMIFLSVFLVNADSKLGPKEVCLKEQEALLNEEVLLDAQKKADRKYYNSEITVAKVLYQNHFENFAKKLAQKVADAEKVKKFENVEDYRRIVREVQKEFNNDKHRLHFSSGPGGFSISVDYTHPLKFGDKSKNYYTIFSFEVSEEDISMRGPSFTSYRNKDGVQHLKLNSFQYDTPGDLAYAKWVQKGKAFNLAKCYQAKVKQEKLPLSAVYQNKKAPIQTKSASALPSVTVLKLN